MFSDIIREFQDGSGENTREVIARYVNRGYRELYDTYDMPNSVVDEYFEIDSSDGQMVLPVYVDQIRGAGAQQERVPFSVMDFRSGYRITPNFQQPYEWRVRRQVSLSGQMDATDRIKITLSEAETQTVNVYITGRTAVSYQTTETVTFTPGETEKITENTWVADNPYLITNVSKDIPTNADVVLQVNSTNKEIARILNYALQSRYTLIQLTDLNPAPLITAPFNGAQIVYKLIWTPLVADTDNIVYTPLEQAVSWKALELWYGNQDGKDAINDMAKCAQKCLTVLNRVMTNMETQAGMKMQMGRNPYYGLWRMSGKWAYRNGPYGYVQN